MIATYLPSLSVVSASVAGTMVSAAWQGVVLAACTVLGMKLFPRIGASARTAIWLAVLALIVSLHFGQMPSEGGALVRANGHSVMHVDARWSVMLAGIWTLLSVVRAVQLLRSAAALRRISRKATPADCGPGIAVLLARGDGGVELCVSDDVDRPSVAGFLAPRILLPVELMAKMSEAELEHIVRHEMEHLRRRDDWTNLLQKLALVLFPLNPALLWVEHRICEERELACDDGVLRATGARKAYATSLAKLAEHSLIRRGVSLALGAWERPSSLAKRVGRILQAPAEGMSARKSYAVVAALILTAAGGSSVLTRSPQLLSFAPAMAVSSAEVQVVPSAALLPAAFHPGTSAAHATLLKAVMPEPPSKPNPLSAKPDTHRVKLHSIKRARPMRAGNRLMMTGWQQVYAAPRMMLTVADDNQFSYAVVSVRSGWLILQL